MFVVTRLNQFLLGRKLALKHITTLCATNRSQPFQNDIFFADTQTIKLNDIKRYLQSNRSNYAVFKRIRSGDWKQCSEAESHFKKEAETLSIREKCHLQKRSTFHTIQIQKTSCGRCPQDASRRQAREKALRMLPSWLRMSQDVKRLVSNWDICRVTYWLLIARSGWIEAFPTNEGATLTVKCVRQ